MPILELINSLFFLLDISIPSIKILPSFSFNIPEISFPIVDFPDPFFPTIVTISPFFMEKLMFFNTFFPFLYLYDTFSILIIATS